MRYKLHFLEAKQYFVYLKTPVDRLEQILQLQAWIIELGKSLDKTLNETITEPRGILILLNEDITKDDLNTTLEKSWETTIQCSFFPYKKWEFPFYRSAETCYDLEYYFKGNTEAIAAYLEAFLSQILKVQFYGFQPGFAYLQGLPSSLHLPRKEKPALEVPAGAVAVGERYVGIYPQNSPGGWQIIGLSPVSLFDRNRKPIFLLEPGDTIQWKEVDAHTYKKLKTKPRYIPNYQDEKIVL